MTLVIVMVSKFHEGAWVVVLLVPLNVALFFECEAHYQAVGREVATDVPLDVSHLEPPIVLLPIRGWSTITRKALPGSPSRSRGPTSMRSHIAGDEEAMVRLEDGWRRLVRKPAERGSPAGTQADRPLLAVIDGSLRP